MGAAFQTIQRCCDAQANYTRTERLNTSAETLLFVAQHDNMAQDDPVLS
jgi:hypothetical protein